MEKAGVSGCEHEICAQERDILSLNLGIARWVINWPRALPSAQKRPFDWQEIKAQNYAMESFWLEHEEVKWRKEAGQITWRLARINVLPRGAQLENPLGLVTTQLSTTPNPVSGFVIDQRDSAAPMSLIC
jgi:hypothetical protein